jgi:hypothetical protein
VLCLARCDLSQKAHGFCLLRGGLQPGDSQPCLVLFTTMKIVIGLGRTQPLRICSQWVRPSPITDFAKRIAA